MRRGRAREWISKSMSDLLRKIQGKVFCGTIVRGLNQKAFICAVFWPNSVSSSHSSITSCRRRFSFVCITHPSVIEHVLVRFGGQYDQENRKNEKSSCVNYCRGRRRRRKNRQREPFIWWLMSSLAACVEYAIRLLFCGGGRFWCGVIKIWITRRERHNDKLYISGMLLSLPDTWRSMPQIGVHVLIPKYLYIQSLSTCLLNNHHILRPRPLTRCTRNRLVRHVENNRIHDLDNSNLLLYRSGTGWEATEVCK